MAEFNRYRVRFVHEYDVLAPNTDRAITIASDIMFESEPSDAIVETSEVVDTHDFYPCNLAGSIGYDPTHRYGVSPINMDMVIPIRSLHSDDSNDDHGDPRLTEALNAMIIEQWEERMEERIGGYPEE